VYGLADDLCGSTSTRMRRKGDFGEIEIVGYAKDFVDLV
jgi:hypothetical protein